MLPSDLYNTITKCTHIYCVWTHIVIIVIYKYIYMNQICRIVDMLPIFEDKRPEPLAESGDEVKQFLREGRVRKDPD